MKTLLAEYAHLHSVPAASLIARLPRRNPARCAGPQPKCGTSQPWPRPQPGRRCVATAFKAEDAASSAPGSSATIVPPRSSQGSSSIPVVTTSWPCKGGELLKVQQQRGSGGGGSHQVKIVLDHSLDFEEGSLPEGSTVELHWGVYRSSPHLWQHPKEVIPPGSTRDERSGAMISSMTAAADGTHSIELAIPAGMAPLTLAFVIAITPPASNGSGRAAGRPPRRHFVTPLRGRHFSALVGIACGSGEVQGVTLLSSSPAEQSQQQQGQPASGSVFGRGTGAALQHSVNFALRCRGAERVCLVLLRPQPLGGERKEWGMLELVLDPVLNRSGEIWHVAVHGLHNLEGLCYGWRLEGDVGWEGGNRLQPYQLLLDPANPALRYFPAEPAAEASPLPLPTITLPDGSGRAVVSSLEGLAAQLEVRQAGQAAALAAQEALAPGPRLALEEMRLLEIDVRTFAQGKGVSRPGSYLGVAERIGHIRAVGANVVVLTPSYATAKGIGLMARTAVHFRAADPLLTSDASPSSVAAASEFRAMVSQLHDAGIEVMLMVDLTFTAEGSDASPNTLSLRGLDYSSHYRANGVLNCGDALTREYILDTLRHWAGEGVDGFCFINAENMVQNRWGTVLDAPPLAEALCHDPRLKHLKLVALASDDSLLPRAGVRGFPHWGLWQQRNTAFGADIMAYLAEGTSGLLTTMAGRLTGSASVFDSDWAAGLPGNLAAGRRPAFGINSITVLGRQSLAELAADAAAAAGAAASAAGSHGAPSGTTIAKSLLALAVLSSGVPVVPQDTVAELTDSYFVGVLMRLRRRLAPLLLPPRFDSPRDIRWHAADATVQPIWDPELAAEAASGGHSSTNYLAFSVRGTGGQGVYLGVNPHPHPVYATLPAPAPGRVWERVVDTSLSAPEDAYLEGGAPLSGNGYTVPSKAVVVFQSVVVEVPGLQQQQQQQPQQVPYVPQQPDYEPAQPQIPTLTPEQMRLRQLLLAREQEQSGYN